MKSMLGNKSKGGGNIIPYLKIYYKATMINAYGMVSKSGPVEENRGTFNYSFCDKQLKNIQQRQIACIINGAGEAG